MCRILAVVQGLTACWLRLSADSVLLRREVFSQHEGWGLPFPVRSCPRFLFLSASGPPVLHCFLPELSLTLGLWQLTQVLTSDCLCS